MCQLKTDKMFIEEFRIGNYVLRKHSDEIICIAEIIENNTLSGGYGVKSKNGDKCSLGYISPIPLTEDLLSKMGFGMAFATDPQEPNPLIVFFLEEFELLMFKDEQTIFHLSGNGFQTNVLYVHQLQNIYFSITGKEMEVKL